MEKRIGTFKDFLKEQRQKKLNEAQINIECAWWDDCFDQVMTEIELELQSIWDWEQLVNFCKQKWSILGRNLPQPEYDDNLLIQHIKDLIFQFHGNSFFTNGENSCEHENQELHSKGIVISELANVILEKVKEKTGQDDKITGIVMDVPLPPDEEDYDDLPFEHKRPVKKFEQYTKLK